MTNPTITDYRESPWTDLGASGSEVTASLTWGTSALLVVLGATEGAGQTMAVPTGTGAGTFTQRLYSGAVASSCNVYAWTAAPAGAGASAITSTNTGSGANDRSSGLAAWAFTSHGGLGASLVSVATSLTRNLTVQGPDSTVVAVLSDWNATTDVTVTTVPAGGTIREASTVSGRNTSLVIEWVGQQAGTRAYGVSSWTGVGNISVALLEVKGTTGGADVTRTPAEAVHVTDQVTASWSRSRTAAEQVHVADQAVTAGSGSVSAAEQVHVTDQVAVSWVRDRTAAEQVHVADAGTPAVTPAAGGDPVTVWAGKEADRGITIPQAANADGALTVGMEVEVVGTPVTVDAVGFYAGTGFVAGGTLQGQIREVPSQAGVAGTFVDFPAISGVPGWQWATFAAPVELPVGVYRVCVFLPAGGYPAQSSYFDVGAGSSGFDDGALHTRSNTETLNGQMVFAYGGAIAYPATSFNATWYGVDVRQPGAAGGDLTRTPAEAAHVTDQVDVTWSRTRTVDESVGVADPGATLDTETHLADDVHVADATTQAAARDRAPADAVYVADATAQQAVRARTQSDPVQVADQASTTATRAREAADTATVDDVVTFTVAYARQAADTIDVPDQVVVHAVRSREPADVVGVADVVVVELASASGQTKSDQVHVVESVTVQRVSFRDAGDQVHVTDQVAPAMARPRTVADQVHVVDQVTAGWVRSRSHAEVVTVVDASARGMARVVTVADLVGVADAAAGVILVGGAGQPLGSPAPEWRTFAVLASSSVISVPLEDDGMTAVAELGVRKDPDAVQDYAVDWTGWLDGDTLASSTWVSMDGLVIDSQSHSGGVSTVVVSGGSNGTVARLRCRVVTGDGRTNDRTVVVPVRHL